MRGSATPARMMRVRVWGDGHTCDTRGRGAAAGAPARVGQEEDEEQKEAEREMQEVQEEGREVEGCEEVGRG